MNLLLIAGVLAVFAQWQFGLSLESLLLGPARDRIVAVANAIGRDLDATPYDGRNELLAEYSQRFGVDFYLTDPRGRSLAGQQIALPQILLNRMRGGARPERDGPRYEDKDGKGPPGRPGPGPGFGGPRMGPPRGLGDPTFLVLTRNPLLYWVGIRMPTNGPQGERGVPAVLLLRANSMFNPKLFFDWRSLLVLAAVLFAIALLCWWPLVHGVTRSIREMDRVTEEIAHGRFDSNVIVHRRDELGHLGEQVNRTAARLKGFVDHQKRFLGDIAHELSAPIARIQFALGILEQKIDEPHQTHVAVLRDEIQEMSALVNELLMFSKAGMQPNETPLKCVALGPVVDRAVTHQVPGAGTIQVSIPPDLTVTAHEPYLLLAISNLLRNALRYAGEDGPILVTARREANRVHLAVIDCGPGLPEESKEEVFAPFFRPEAARSRDTGGAGLGLAIVKSCVEACRGTVACRNREPSGLEVTISLAVGD